MRRHMKFQKLISFFSRTKIAQLASTQPAINTTTGKIRALKTKGNEFLNRGKLYEAIASYQEVVQLSPGEAGAYVALGFAQLEAAELDAAKVTFTQALVLDAESVDVHFFMGQLLALQRLPKQALQSFKAALALKPDFDFAWCELARVHEGLADLNAALKAYEKALDISPLFADAVVGRVKVLLGLERWQDALNTVTSAALPEEHYLLFVYQALALQRLKRSDEALVVIENALLKQPDSVEALQVKGTVLAALGQHAAALPVYLRAIELDPNFASALSDAGAIYAKTGDYDRALQLYSCAVAAQPDHADALYNYCTAFLHMGQCKDAIDIANKGLAYHPEHADMHWVKGAALLRSGEFNQGWQEYEWRWHAKLLGSNPIKLQHAQPQWIGQSIHGKTIWLQAEQGLGDTIQLLRYVPLLAAMGATVLLSVKEPVIPLCRALKRYCILLKRGQAIPAFDFYCPLFSLPLAFKTDLATIPAKVPYLHSEPELQAAWAQKLGATALPRVGLVWSGNAAFQNDEKRSVPLSSLITALPNTCSYVSLQQEVRQSDEVALVQSSILDVRGELKNFADTAALISCLDLVISVDTSVAHLAGALAKPVWIILPHSPDWRWLMQRNDSPWYPTARLFRQGSDRKWLPLLTNLGGDLANI